MARDLTTDGGAEMTFVSIELLHPGDTGAGIGAALVGAGLHVSWASEGRGPATARRDERAVADTATLRAVLTALSGPSTDQGTSGGQHARGPADEQFG
jgi:hypothetical protein